MSDDRFKLAEAMGWTIGHPDNPMMSEWWFPPGQRGGDGNSTKILPDPFTDANDDYAVLEWMRAKDNDDAAWSSAESEFMHLMSSTSCSRYQIGDYARAALTVLQEAQEKS
jgi:hypothetical protein